MKLILSTHNLTLTKSIEAHVVKCIKKLDHFDPRAIDARVTLEHDHTRVPEKQFSCSMRLGIRGPDHRTRFDAAKDQVARGATDFDARWGRTRAKTSITTAATTAGGWWLYAPGSSFSGRAKSRRSPMIFPQRVISLSMRPAI